MLAPVKFVPLIVTDVPPAAGPFSPSRCVTAGGGPSASRSSANDSEARGVDLERPGRRVFEVRRARPCEVPDFAEPGCERGDQQHIDGAGEGVSRDAATFEVVEFGPARRRRA